jgi:hypothetical protein
LFSLEEDFPSSYGLNADEDIISPENFDDISDEARYDLSF